jgi:hypothetical protein
VSSIITPDAIRIARLQNMFAVDMSLRLFTDSLAGLTDADLADLETGDFTEPGFAGYSPITLTSANWGYTAGAGDPAAALYNAAQTFERSTTGASETVYGYLVRRSSDSVLSYFHPFDGPITFTSIGHRFRFTPRYEA